MEIKGRESTKERNGRCCPQAELESRSIETRLRIKR